MVYIVPELHHLIYQSCTEIEMPQQALNTLVKRARFNNFIYQITGLLLYGEQQFIQVLEGDKDNLDIIFKKILLDDRHHKIQMLAYTPIAERSFVNWNMGFVLFSQQPELKNALIEQKIVKNFYSPFSDHESINLIKSFSHKDFIACIN